MERNKWNLVNGGVMRTYAPAREVESGALLVACSDHGFAPGLEDFIIDEFGLDRRGFHRVLVFGGPGIIANPEVSEAKFQGIMEDIELYHKSHPNGTIILSSHFGCTWYEINGFPPHQTRTDLFQAGRETKLLFPRAKTVLVYGSFVDLQRIKTSRIVFEVVASTQGHVLTTTTSI